MTQELIDAVRKHAVLYDTNNADYTRSKFKDEIWEGIAEGLNLIDGAEAKNAWLKLRNCHRDALRRQRKCLKSGAAATTIKEWKFQNQMEFLIPYMANRPREDNVDNDNDSKELYEESEEQFEHMETENKKIPKTENTKISEANINVVEESGEFMKPSSISSTRISTPLKKKIKKKDIGTMLKLSFQRHKQITQKRALARTKIEQQKTPNDHLYHFFISMYKITKEMPPQSQHLVRNKVFQSVSQIEADLLNINDYHPSG